VMKQLQHAFMSFKKHAQKPIDWRRGSDIAWQEYIDWDIVAIAICLFVVFIFSESMYVHFLRLQLTGVKVVLLLLYSVFFSFLLSLIKNSIVRRGVLLLLVLFIGGLYFVEATYFAVFKTFALWSQFIRLDELIGIKDQAGNFIRDEFHVFFLPAIVLVLLYVIDWSYAFTHRIKVSIRKAFSLKEKVIGICVSLLCLLLVGVYCIYGLGDMNKLYLKNSVDYVNKYSLFDGFIVNSIESVIPIFKEPEPIGAEIEREFGIVDSPNKQTNLYKDKNLIFIEGESIAPFAIDPVLTPTLYRLQREAYAFNNYFSPRANTLNSEYALMNSFYLTLEKEEEPFSPKGSMAGLFKKKGYSTQAFHDYVPNFYGRAEKLPQSGFDEFYHVYDLNIDFELPEFPSDVELFVNSFPHIANKDRFLAYYITVSGHSGYDIVGRPSLNDNFKRVQARFPEYDEEVQTYLAAAMVTDQGVGKLYEDLERTGKLDDTVIVFAGDHYPYALDDELLQETFHIEPQLYLYKTPFFIWDVTRPAQVRTDLMSNVDVLPTLSNLFGLDLKYGMGQDMFSDRVSDVIVEWYDFRTYSFLTPQGGYDGLTYEIIGNLTPRQVTEIQQRTYLRERLNNSKYLRDLLKDDPVDTKKIGAVAGHIMQTKMKTSGTIFVYNRRYD